MLKIAQYVTLAQILVIHVGLAFKNIKIPQIKNINAKFAMLDVLDVITTENGVINA